jgi:ADP-heptose:LPS heptosyltransferase
MTIESLPLSDILERPQGNAPATPDTLNPRRVAVFRALQLGDMLCAVPALRAIRRLWPRARITLIGLPWARDFAARFACYIDDFLEFPGYPGLPERTPDAEGWPRFLAQTKERDFDLAIQLHGDGTRTNAVVEAFGARRMAGFDPQRTHGLFLSYPEEGAEPARLLRLAAHLGADTSDTRLEFPLRPEDDAHWAPYPAVRGLEPGRYLCIHAGARAAERRWPVENFAAVADALAVQTGLKVVLTGSGEEASLTRALAQAMKTPVIDAAAPVPVGALAAVIARGRLLIGNDTGTSHLAAALAVPSVIVFRISDPQRWAPLDRERHRVVRDPEGTRTEEVLREAGGLLNPVPTP